jgi:hypothetical protein
VSATIAAARSRKAAASDAPAVVEVVGLEDLEIDLAD